MLNKKIAAFAVVAAALTAPAAVAQMPSPKEEPFVHLSVADIAAKMPAPATPNGVSIFRLDQHEDYYTQVAGRTVDGSVEMHDHWIDYFSILSGEATLTWGGTVTGGTKNEQGETYGGTLTGGTKVTLKPGDYVRILPGVPHQLTGPKNNFRYLVTKIRR